jgi:hypothetical protein
MNQGKEKKHKNRYTKKKEEVNFFSSEGEGSNEIVHFKNIPIFLCLEINCVWNQASMLIFTNIYP